MDSLQNPIPNIQGAKHRDELYFCQHAIEMMLSRRITLQQVEQALDCNEATVLENYPSVGLPSAHCLIMGTDGDGKYIHVVIAYSSTIEVTTVYEPALPKWINPHQRGG